VPPGPPGPPAPGEPTPPPAPERPTPQPVPAPVPGPDQPDPLPPPGPPPGAPVHATAPGAPTPAAPPVAPPASDPSDWGRVAEDGTVFVRTDDGERPVGSYPGATPEEALAYFGRKFDELSGQVTLLEQRLDVAGLAPKDAESSIQHLREAIPEAHAVGDLAGLTARLAALTDKVAQRRRTADAARAKAREEARAVKTRLVEEAEGLVMSGDWKRAGDRLRTLLEEWKGAPRLDRKSDDALWKRFSQARTGFDKRRRAHFAELDEERTESAARKEKLIKEAEALSTSTEWGPTAGRYRELMTQWKEAGRARRDVEDGLWERFKAAQDAFFTARSQVFSARDADLQVNLERKEALVTEAEALLPVGDPRSARAAMRGIHERWEAIGHVPRSARDRVEGRLKKVDDTVRAAEDAQWRRSNPEARARAEATVAQLRHSIEQLDAEAATAREAGSSEKAEKAEAAAAARRSWLTEAEKTLEEFSR
jgi:hypothetical protein